MYIQPNLTPESRLILVWAFYQWINIIKYFCDTKHDFSVLNRFVALSKVKFLNTIKRTDVLTECTYYNQFMAPETEVLRSGSTKQESFAIRICLESIVFSYVLFIYIYLFIMSCLNLLVIWHITAYTKTAWSRNSRRVHFVKMSTKLL